MPCSAIATGLVDFQLPPAEMPAQLIAYTTHAFGKLPQPATARTPKSDSALKKIFILLRAQTGHDFSQYKPSTIHRRIERRMAVHQIAEMDDYVRYLQQTPPEVEALFRDLLIGVTSFFRDADAFRVLETQAIPRLFDGKPVGAALRVWAPGCSSGEEAYSIAILLHEYMEGIKQNYLVQVFATDIDSQAIATARSGLYPASIAADVSPRRLARFFTATHDGGAFRVSKGIRDLLVFSEQDVIKDPPFSKLDLISCRNLLIYFGAELQKKVIPLFNYALNPGGLLFLGTSEGVGEFDDLFAVLDRKAKLFQRRETLYGGQRARPGRLLLPAAEHAAAPARAAGKTAVGEKPSLREVTEQAILRHLAPAAALIDSQGDIHYLHGRTGLYLEPSPGEAGVNNILKMAREGLRRALRAALHKAAGSREAVSMPGLRIKSNGHFSRANLSVCPVTAGPASPVEAALYLVLFEAAPDPAVGEPAVLPPASAGAENGAGADADASIAALRQELRVKDDDLQATNEELETSNEELKSSNEEMQSINEELQSSNEELETSKEELQSVNEELSTVNNELQTKVADLSRANNDMNNLLAGTGIATVFIDHQLRILRFTPAVREIINLILSDVGRPVGHLAFKLVGYDNLVADAQHVLDTLVPKQLDVQARDGKWYTLRIQPYRTLDNVIEGAVITFVDITEVVRGREELRRLAVIVNDAHDAITMQDVDGRILAWNPGAVRMYGWSEAEALQMNARERIPQELRDDARVKEDQLGRCEILPPFRTRAMTKSGAVLDIWKTATALLDEAGHVYAIATTEKLDDPGKSG
jgi:two-component system CheB/CheR fusion protein